MKWFGSGERKKSPPLPPPLPGQTSGEVLPFSRVDSGDEKDKFRTMHENHAAAQAMAALEKYFNSLDIAAEPDQSEIARLTAGIPAHTRTRFTNGLEKYFRLRKDAQACKRILDEEVASIRKNMRGVSNDEDALDLFVRHRIFQEIVPGGGNPWGRITARIAGPYLFLGCTNAADYKRLYAGMPFKYIDKSAPDSSACYVRARPLNAFHKNRIGIVILNHPLTADAEVQVAIDHEAQHLIGNEILSLFAESEEGGDSKYTRAVKDELIATIRDATATERFTEMHVSKNYEHLFSALPDEAQRKAALEAAKALAEFMDKRGYFAAPSGQSVPSRAELAYRLVPIKLRDWPKWLDLMDRYDEHRLKRKQGEEISAWMGMNSSG